jgi:hypothetical protein
MEHLLDFRRRVAVDLATQANFFDFGTGPDLGLHDILLSDCNVCFDVGLESWLLQDYAELEQRFAATNQT